VAGVAPPARLPAVHPLAGGDVLVALDRRSRQDQVLAPGEELVVGNHDRAADALAREIDEV
jgi:hypothetical protein